MQTQRMQQNSKKQQDPTPDPRTFNDFIQMTKPHVEDSRQEQESALKQLQ